MALRKARTLIAMAAGSVAATTAPCGPAIRVLSQCNFYVHVHMLLHYERGGARGMMLAALTMKLPAQHPCKPMHSTELGVGLESRTHRETVAE